MKKMKNVLCLLLICFLTFGSVSQIMAAKDTKGTASKKARVQTMLDSTFQPNQPVTRIQAITSIVRLIGFENEAKAVSASTKLPFKDASQLDKKYPGAKGYVVVALERGLIDAKEGQIQPEKPASRAWLSILLVKSLGLQADALLEMNKLPAFTDAKAIPAGAVGYVNVAVKQGLFSGYPDKTFKSNKNVTGAEMSVLLDRVKNILFKNAGVIVVGGTITNILFTPSVTNNTYNSTTVTDNVYLPINGQITIITQKKETVSYGISSELLVKYHNKFIPAKQLAVNEKVSLTVLDKNVIKATLFEMSKPDNRKTVPTPAKKESKVEKDFKKDKELKGQRSQRR